MNWSIAIEEKKAEEKEGNLHLTPTSNLNRIEEVRQSCLKFVFQMEKKKMAKRGRPAGQPQKPRAIRDPSLPPIERKRINDSDFVKAVVRAN